MRNTENSYGRIAQILHWASTLLILVLWPLGFAMVRLGDAPVRPTLYMAHIAIAWLVLLLTAVRIVWRFVDRTPELPAGMEGNGALLFRGVHLLQYISMVVLLFSGVAMMALSGFVPGSGPIDPNVFHDLGPAMVHSYTSPVFALLLVAHVAGVMMHQFTKSDVMGRMGIPFPGKKA